MVKLSELVVFHIVRPLIDNPLTLSIAFRMDCTGTGDNVFISAKNSHNHLIILVIFLYFLVYTLQYYSGILRQGKICFVYWGGIHKIWFKINEFL